MPYISPHISNSQVSIGYRTHPGIAGRNNEDDYGIFVTRSPNSSGVLIAAVADGIGGSPGGEYASSLAIQAVATALEPLAQSDCPAIKQVDIVARLANRVIRRMANEQGELAGAGTTLVLAAIEGNSLYVGHVGDSRCYIVRDGCAYLLTLDHSWVQEAFVAGRLSLDEASKHPNRHVIKRYLGANTEMPIDLNMVDIVTPGISRHIDRKPAMTQEVALIEGDSILLCSDGLSDVLDIHTIGKIVSRNATQQAANRLVNLANERDGSDNVTVIIVRLGTDRPQSREQQQRSRFAWFFQRNKA